MKLRDSFRGNERFEGDRVLRWRTIPANARIVAAKATITPIDAGVVTPFAEVLNFNRIGEFGATRTSGSVALPVPGTAWVEVDFHARRTLASVAGNFSGATLQVDVGGGTYVEINRAGAFKTPSDPTDFSLTSSGGPVSLPALSVAKLKLTHASTTSPDLQTIVVRSLPTNVSLRLEPLSPFFTHPGELTLAETSSDFATVLQAALVDARIENGFYDLLLTLHSDTIARLQVDLEIDFVAENHPLPDGLAEVVLPFDFSTLAQSTAATLDVAVPPNSRVVPELTTARVRGNFTESRIAYGPTGAAKSVAAVEVSAASSQAQLIAVADKDVPVTAIDLLLESKTASSELRVDIRNDLDGKPGDDSLLTKPVELTASSQTGKGARWESVALGGERLLSKSRRYWLVVQCIQGTVAWYVDAPQTITITDAGTSAAAPRQPIDLATSESFNVQTTRDGGLSWRDAVAMPGTLVEAATSAGPFVAFFRLRTQPKTFKVPIELLATTATSEVRIKLDRFAPLGRVDFALDTELAQGINGALAEAPAGTATDAEHLLNGDFERWISLGDEISAQPTTIRTGVPMDGVAFSPDGTLLYVLDQALDEHRIFVIDPACNRFKQPPIALTSRPPGQGPVAFVISPDGTRAFVTNGSTIEVVNLLTNHVLGQLNLNLVTNERAVRTLALSPDGAFLYAPTFHFITNSANRIHVIDTARLERELVNGLTPTPAHVADTPAVTGQPTGVSPSALAVSPDGRVLYLLLGGTSQPVVRILDSASVNTVTAITVRDVPLPVPSPTSLALSRDGGLAVVGIGAGITTGVVLLDIVSGNATPVIISGTAVNVTDVAISPDGTRAYALNPTNDSISVIDLKRQATVGIPILINGADPTPRAFALSPQGDQLWVAVEEDAVSRSFVLPIYIGKRLPADWHLTEGEATPYCVDAPFHLVSIIGSQLAHTGLSQVISVTGSTLYEFSFWGIGRASETDVTSAVAEVFWLGEDCGAIGPPISIPIQPMAQPPTVAAGAPRAELIFGASGSGGSSLLRLHRARATSPAGARQAEVRFTIPSEGLAAIDLASLIATSEATLNGDFQQQEGGQLNGWKISPTNAPGFHVLATADGIQLMNGSATSVELSQVVDAKSHEPFTLGVEGRTTAVAATNPQIDVRWSKSDGTATGSPTAVEIDSGSSSFAVATGTSPEDAVHAEIHLTVPAGSTLEVKRATLRFAPPTIVKVSFIAEAPGELIVSDVRVAFEEVESTGPPRDVPLCIATPPGQEPGKDDCPCDVCATDDSGEDEAAEPMAQPVVVSHLSLPSAPPLMTTPHALHLTDVPGIAEARARQLTQIGIDSVEKLANSTPQTVAQIKFITPQMASRLIAEAKALTLG